MCGAVRALSMASAKNAAAKALIPSRVRLRPGLEGGDDLRPDGNHADEQRQRCKGSGFFDDGAEHCASPRYRMSEQDMNIVHDMFLVKGRFSLIHGSESRLTSFELEDL
jgi:hypothetical protein